MTFPDEFFRDETREGFFVPELMKRAWAAELEVLQVVADICERYGIQWFADWGTMLGAVRHQGFIPWDDDIDICLKRPDYDRLVALLRTELPAGFVLTGMYAEDRRLQRAAAFPQSRVMADEEHWDLLSYMRRFHGFPFFRVGIDIFPVDGMPEDPKLVEEQKHRMMEIWRVLEKWIRNENYPLKNCEAQLKKIEKLCGISLVRDDTLANQLWRLYDSICSLYTVDDSEFMAEYHFLFNNGKRFYRKKCFKEAVWLPFENISLPVPDGYDEILTAFWGDYMNPVNSGADHDYPFYVNQQKELEKIFRKQGITRSIPQFCRDYMEQTVREQRRLKEELIKTADCFYEDSIKEGMELFAAVMEKVVKIPELAQYAGPLLDALEKQNYAQAADILCHDMAERIT